MQKKGLIDEIKDFDAEKLKRMVSGSEFHDLRSIKEETISDMKSLGKQIQMHFSQTIEEKFQKTARKADKAIDQVKGIFGGTSPELGMKLRLMKKPFSQIVQKESLLIPTELKLSRSKSVNEEPSSSQVESAAT